MDLQGHMNTLGMNNRALARATGLSEITIKKAKEGRLIKQQTVDWLLAALTLQYGRTVAREEVDGLLVEDESQP